MNAENCLFPFTATLPRDKMERFGYAALPMHILSNPARLKSVTRHLSVCQSVFSQRRFVANESETSFMQTTGCGRVFRRRFPLQWRARHWHKLLFASSRGGQIKMSGTDGKSNGSPVTGWCFKSFGLLLLQLCQKVADQMAVRAHKHSTQ